MKGRKHFSYLRALYRILFVIVSNLYTIPAYCIWLAMLHPLKSVSEKLFIKVENLLYSWVVGVVSLWSWSAGYNIKHMGDNLEPCSVGKTLILVNHQTAGDVLILMALFNSCKIFYNFVWIMDWIFSFTHFGLLSLFHKDFFIHSGTREKSMNELKAYLKEDFLKTTNKFLILFPEGDFVESCRKPSREYALKHGITNQIKNVALPRTGALLAVMDVVRSKIKDYDFHEQLYLNNFYTDKEMFKINDKELKWILDITIAYPNGQPLDLLTIVAGSREACTTYIMYRLYDVTKLPRNDEAIIKWIYQLWDEKDELLEALHKCDVPLSSCPRHCKAGGKLIKPINLKQDVPQIIFANVFYLLSTYLHYHMLRSILSIFGINI